jgi:hypothetical protein
MFFILYMLGLCVVYKCVNKFTPVPVDNPGNTAAALWTLGMLLGGGIVGAGIPQIYYDDVLASHFNPEWLHRLAVAVGGILGVLIAFRGRLLIAQISLIVFILYGIAALFRFVF